MLRRVVASQPTVPPTVPPTDQPRQRYADVVGDLVAWRDGVLTVRTRRGEVVQVEEATLVAGKRVPAPRFAHAADAGAMDVHRASTAGWRPLETTKLGGWLLRAGGGFTGRANSVLPLGEPGLPLDDALAHVLGWYAERGLSARFQLPLPVVAELDAELDVRGWRVGDSADVLVADVRAALDTLPPPDGSRTSDALPAPVALPPVRVEDRPDDDWLAAYHYRGGTLPPVAVEVLTNHDRPGFASVRDGTTLLAIARGAVDDGWLGVTSVEVAPSARRRGLGRHVMRGLLSWGAGLGARHVHLQVDVHNGAARAMYLGMAFTHHHTYRYRHAP